MFFHTSAEEKVRCLRLKRKLKQALMPKLHNVQNTREKVAQYLTCKTQLLEIFIYSTFQQALYVLYKQTSYIIVASLCFLIITKLLSPNLSSSHRDPWQCVHSRTLGAAQCFLFVFVLILFIVLLYIERKHLKNAINATLFLEPPAA